ncbi:MAG: hypothetical protein MMC33_005981 [Icmadophila ericetorum]|nr:hypothetical protein [Icmadophila ericetorum]
MGDTEQALEEEKPPAALPPSAYVRGRRASVEPKAPAKIQPPVVVESKPQPTLESVSEPAVELDDFGLPLKRTKPKDLKEEAPTSEGKEPTSDQANTSPASQSRSRSSHSSSKFQSAAASRASSAEPAHHGPEKTSEPEPQELSKAPKEQGPASPISPRHSKDAAIIPVGGISEWSHQVLAPNQIAEEKNEEEDEWQDMPAYGEFDVYDDEGRLVARATPKDTEDTDVYEGLGGAKKGYTRVQIDEDAKSATSMDENTSYLFKEKGTDLVDEHEDQRDPLAQMQATKDMLTEGQRIAYVGVARLAMVQMVKELEESQGAKGTKKEFAMAIESMKKWSQKMMVRLYGHMEINSSEQVMIEQLGEHGVQTRDLTPILMQNSRVRNPMAAETSSITSSPNPEKFFSYEDEDGAQPPPAYEVHKDDELPEVRNPAHLPVTKDIVIDIRWTILCDMFLVLIADSIYDARSRSLLERIGEAMEISWLDICRFEKRVTDALEMQEAAAKENWDEAAHMEARRKQALKRKYIMMGLATVGGSLVIGLSAGVLAPVIGAGLAAGFTTIGVAGTSGFLTGVGGISLITSGAVLSGGTIGLKAAHRRTGAVKTFEYRPLHANKRVNLIVTISGWMNGKIDDVRLPFSTIDPIMGDMYSVLWEPDMLQSMGDTIRILATEALTQGLQQVLASTILTALMGALTLPIVLTKLAYLIDNPWTVSLDRADAAGLILADSLMDRNLGVRPITLVGFSLGSRVIFSCLRELAKRGAYGLVQNVYLFGAPVVAEKEQWLRARTVISGRFVNGYASNDWILGYLFRATSGGIYRVAGLAAVDIPGLENINFTKLVNGHMAYRAAMPRLLREAGWSIESLDFTEIEDPDPENHEARQRQLIRELDEARKEAEAKPGKRRFGIFKRGKLAEKKGWETYDESLKAAPESSNTQETEKIQNAGLFDIDAIRAELAGEHMEVRQLESTLPPMKLTLNGTNSTPPEKSQEPPPSLRETKSFDGTQLSGSVRSKEPETRSFADEHDPDVGDRKLRHEDLDGCYSNDEDKLELSFEPAPHPLAGFARHAEAQQQHPPPPSPPTRPQLSHAVTMPSNLNHINLEHNAWVDEDEDGELFGHEREMKLSFE